MRLLLFPLKHSQRCGSVDRQSMPALASWLAGDWAGCCKIDSGRVRERECALQAEDGAWKSGYNLFTGDDEPTGSVNAAFSRLPIETEGINNV